MNPQATSAFDLSDSLSPKAGPELIAEDDRHFSAIRESLDQTIADLSERLDTLRRAPTGKVREVLDRDMEVHRLSARLRTLRRFGSDLCLGRMVGADGSEPVYVGRLGLTDRDGERLLIDWRSPAAEPFFAATHANPMGLVSRRRYRWNLGRISDYWDEVFTEEGFEGNAALDDQSAFIASLGANRSDRMRDVLSTIQADQDAIIRAGASGALVVDGGPGTGKTVVALHRTAHLLYSDSRLGHRRGGVLFVGPHQPYLAYVADVLPSLGEEGVQTCTPRDLVPEGTATRAETDPEAARLKSSAELLKAIEPAVFARRGVIRARRPATLLRARCATSCNASVSVMRSSAATATSVCSALSATVSISLASVSRASARRRVAPSRACRLIAVNIFGSSSRSTIAARTSALELSRATSTSSFVRPSAASCRTAAIACDASSVSAPMPASPRIASARTPSSGSVRATSASTATSSIRETADRRTRGSASSRATVWSASASSGPSS